MQDPFQELRIYGRKIELSLNGKDREDVESGKNLYVPGKSTIPITY